MNETSENKDRMKSQLRPVSSSPPMFDHEKLDVYQLELQFVAWVTDLLEEVSKTPAGKTREVCDQLDRASLSALLDTAEGNGKRQRQGRAKFFDDARGSATEYAACLDALVAKRATIIEARKLELPTQSVSGARRSRRFSVKNASGLGVPRAACFWTLKRRERRVPSLYCTSLNKERVLDGKKMLVRIVSMLCGLVDRYDSPGQLRDESSEFQLDPVREPHSVSYKTNKSRMRTRTTTTRRNRI